MSIPRAPAVIDCVTNSLFEEDYWLDSVAPGNWDKVEISKNGVVIGRLPFIVRQRGPIRAITTTWCTPWLGPWIKSTGGKTTSEIGHQHDVLRGLIEGLPKADMTRIACAPEFSNLMAFHWGGYALHLHYTYRFETLADERALWQGLRDNTRNHCRKAEKTVVVTTERTLADIMPVLDATYRRQSVDFSASYAVIERIDATMRERGQRIIYAAEDASGRIHAFAYVVHDERHAFYLVGGADPALRESGAQSLVVWHALKGASAHSRAFDFEGSMVAGIEPFVRGFGGNLTPRYVAERSSTTGAAVEFVLKHSRRLLRGA